MPDLEEVLMNALSLSVQDRASLAERLLASLQAIGSTLSALKSRGLISMSHRLRADFCDDARHEKTRVVRASWTFRERIGGAGSRQVEQHDPELSVRSRSRDKSRSCSNGIH